jgi:putative aldouronate transport system permease protein
MKNMTDEKKFNMVGTVILSILAIIALMPIILIVIASFSDEQSLLSNGYSYLPSKWSLNAYYYTESPFLLQYLEQLSVCL